MEWIPAYVGMTGKHIGDLRRFDKLPQIDDAARVQFVLLIKTVTLAARTR